MARPEKQLYRDFSQVKGDEESKAEGTLPPRPEGSSMTFPAKLHFMLSVCEEEGLDSIVSWQPHGRCFIVHKQQEFVDKILPRFFRQTKFASFQRQLNLYGLERITIGRDKNGYYHELFLRGKPYLARHIRRIKIKGQGVRKPSHPDTEPNFYLMPPLPPEDRSTPVSGTQLSPTSPPLLAEGLGAPSNVGSLALQQMLLNNPELSPLHFLLQPRPSSEGLSLALARALLSRHQAAPPLPALPALDRAAAAAAIALQLPSLAAALEPRLPLPPIGTSIALIREELRQAAAGRPPADEGGLPYLCLGLQKE